MLRIPLVCLDNRKRDGGKVVSPMHQQRSTPQKHYFSVSGTYFCQRLRKPQDVVRLEGLSKLKKFNHLIGFRTHNLPACSTMPQPTMLPHFIDNYYRDDDNYYRDNKI
jgi:hypothetical protein